MKTDELANFQKPKLPKLSVPEVAKFREILGFMVTSIEIRIEEIREYDFPPIARKWKTNSLRWLRHQRAAYVMLDNMIKQQKDFGDVEGSD